MSIDLNSIDFSGSKMIDPDTIDFSGATVLSEESVSTQPIQQDANQDIADIENSANGFAPEEAPVEDSMQAKFDSMTQGMSEEDKKAFVGQLFKGTVEGVIDANNTPDEFTVEQQAKRQLSQEEREASNVRREEGTQTFGDKFKDVLFTEEAVSTESGPGFGGVVAGAGGVLSLPTRALGALAGKIGITDEQDISSIESNILKPWADDLKEWTESREGQNKNIDVLANQLENTLKEKGDELPHRLVVKMQKQIDDLRDQKNSEFFTGLVDIVGGVSLGIGGDPLAAVSLGSSQALKSAGKSIAKKVRGRDVGITAPEKLENIIDASDKTIAAATKKINPLGELKAEKILGETGTPTEIISNLKKKNITRGSDGVVTVPGSYLEKNIDKVISKRIDKLDAAEVVEAKIPPVPKKNALVAILKDNVAKKFNHLELADEIVEAKGNVGLISDILEEAKFPNFDEVAGIISTPGNTINGIELRQIIQAVNKTVKDVKVKNATQKKSGNVVDATKKMLKSGVRKVTDEEGLSKYTADLEFGTGDFVFKKGKLKVLSSAKLDPTLSKSEQIKKIGNMVDEAKAEYVSGNPGKAVENLEEIDLEFASDLNQTAKELGMLERFDPTASGKVSAKLVDKDSPEFASVGAARLTAGKPGAGIAAGEGIRKRVFRAIKEGKLNSAIRSAAKASGDKAKAKEVLNILNSSKSEKQDFILDIMMGEDNVNVLNSFISKGVMTPKIIVESLGKEEIDRVIEKAEASNDLKSRSLAKRLSREL